MNYSVVVREKSDILMKQRKAGVLCEAACRQQSLLNNRRAHNRDRDHAKRESDYEV